MRCQKCNIDSDMVTSGDCHCPKLWTLCPCGEYTRTDKPHYHINEHIKKGKL